MAQIQMLIRAYYKHFPLTGFEIPTNGLIITGREPLRTDGHRKKIKPI